MIWLLSWLVYGLIVGALAKWIHPGDEPSGILSTIGIGVVGSYLGGFLNYLLHGHGSPFSASGILMGVVGAVIFLFVFEAVKAVKKRVG